MTGHLDRDQLVRWRDHGTAVDREAVLGHLAACQPCAAVYAELMRTAPVTAQVTHFDPADFVTRGYAVRERIARQSGAASASNRRSPGWFEILWNPPVTLARAAVITQLALVVLIGAAVIVPRLREPAFTTLSGPSTAGRGVRLTVMFQPTVTEAAMRRTLLDIGGTVVSGPSALGVYIVQVPGRPDDDPAVQAVIDKLRATAGVVHFVEREP